MTPEHFGLFDTPASPREIRFAAAVIAMFAASFFLTLPFSDIRVGQVVAFVPVIDAVVLVGELIIATMLYAQAAIFGSLALTVLASGFVFAALLLIPHALTFPGAFAPNGLLHPGLNSTGWIMIFRRVGFPMSVIAYAVAKRRETTQESMIRRSTTSMLWWVAGAFAIAVGVTALAIEGDSVLPTMFVSHSAAIYSNLTVFNVSNIVLVAIAMATLLKRPTVLDIWLLIGLSGWLIQSLLNLPVHERFTFGWYTLFCVTLLSHLFVLLALIGESNRLYARLVMSRAAHIMERDARLMSMDAVAAAISHEVGQPLAAISLNASVGVKSLTRPRPNLNQAVECFRAIGDSAQRSFAIIKGVRAMFASDPEWGGEFNLNDMVRETAALLNTELAAAKVSLQLSLDEQLPPFFANRVQLQQVLVNLLKNAIESSASTRRRSRSIGVRSRLEDENMLLEVSDDGAGIPTDELPYIFEAFHTTKAAGTGIGLSLCRTIVEEHGGRIWVSQGTKHGATFHVQLPRTSAAPFPALHR